MKLSELNDRTYKINGVYHLEIEKIGKNFIAYLVETLTNTHLDNSGVRTQDCTIDEIVKLMFEENNIEEKYFVELYEDDDSSSYIIQTDLFNTIDQAKQWADQIDFKDNHIHGDIMYVVFKDDELVGDIEIKIKGVI